MSCNDLSERLATVIFSQNKLYAALRQLIFLFKPMITVFPSICKCIALEVVLL